MLCVQIHIFLVMVVSLVLKFLSSEGTHNQEVLTAWFYDYILLGSFIASVPVGFVWTVVAKRSMMAEALVDRAALGDDEDSLTKAKQRAVRLLHLGLTTDDDVRLLAKYFEGLENMVNRWSHVFISYRVASDRDLARRLYDSLSALTIEETGQKLRVYLDATRLEDGKRWDSGFMEGLSRSWVFVPIVSVGSVQPMMSLGLSEGEDWCDNVLLEWTAALELYQRGIIKAVLPLMASQVDFFSDAKDAFGGVPALPTHVSAATMEQVVLHLQDNTDDGSTDGLEELVQQASSQSEPTIQGVVTSLLKFQGIKVTAGAAGAAHSHGHLSVGMDDLTGVVDRVHTAVSASLKRIGMEEVEADISSRSPDKSVSVLGRLSSRLSSMSPVPLVGGGTRRDGGAAVEIQFGGDDGGGGSELYLSPG